MTPVFQDEVQLAGWSETHNGGAKVTFWLSDSSALEAFRRMTVAKGKIAGQRLACVLVEIGDDEQPVESPVEVPVKQPGEKLTGLALLAVQWCQDSVFINWLQVENEYQAKLAVCEICGITSRKELNTNKGAAILFDQNIRGPFMMHLNGGNR